MKDWKGALVKPTDSIKAVVEIIDRTALQIALVVSEECRLLGTVTDGDIRRGIMSGTAMESPVETIMYTSPTVASTDDSRDEILSMMKQRDLRQIPIVNHQGVLVGLETLVQLLKNQTVPNHVVLMAGGLGKRLHPLTENVPKPMLKVGTRPILETIIANFVDYGFEKFYLAVNYRAAMIKEYFGNGDKFGVQIEYIEETKRLGTAGALSLIPKELEHPFIVMNGDILTKVNFGRLLEFHLKQEALGTMCVREYDFQVPYGVVQVDQQQITQIVEKPVHHFFVNAGIYALNPETLKLIPSNTFFDMPDLFNALLGKELKTTVFPVREYWMDVGQMEDFQKANGEFNRVFRSSD